MYRITLTLLLITGLTAGATTASAATFTVSSGSDNYADDSVCTLREAIVSVDLHTATGGCPAGTASNTIVLSTPSVTLTRSGAGEDAGLTGDLDLSGNLTIQGAPGGTTVDAAHLDRVFDVAAGSTATIKDVTVTGGLTRTGGPGTSGSNPDYGAKGENGGGIRNAGSLTLEHVTVTGNVTGNGGPGGNLSGGGFGARGGTGGFGGDGGGVFNSGTITVDASNLTGNATGVGGSSGSAVGTSSSGGTATGGAGDAGFAGGGGNGAGLDTAGPTVITDSTITANRTGNGGSGTSGSGGAGSSSTSGGSRGGEGSGGPGGWGGRGGGIMVSDGPVTIARSLISSNVTGNGGAGGSGFAGGGGNGEIAGSGTGAGGDGGNGFGGAGGKGGYGGGISAQPGVHPPLLTITSSTIVDNAIGHGSIGGNGVGGPGGKAGGAATGGDGGNGYAGGGGSGADGGAIFAYGNTDSSLISGSTVAGNAAGLPATPGTGSGGLAGSGFSRGQPGFSQSGSAGTPGTGGGVAGVPVRGSIVASNTPNNCSAVPVLDGGTLGNVVFPDATCPGLVADPKLGPLAVHGGVTQVPGLLPGSPAIDAVATGDAGCPATDQRGVARPQGAACDAGAFELAPPAVTGLSVALTLPSAVLSAMVTPNAQPTTYRFAWGPVDAPTTLTAPQSVAAGLAPAPVSAMISGLASNTSYGFRVIATNDDGTTTSAGQPFSLLTIPDQSVQSAVGDGAAAGSGGSGGSDATITPPPPKPVITALTLRPSSFTVATKRQRKGRGTTITYTDTLAVTTTFSVARATTGVKSGTACVAPPKHPPSGKKPKPCRRFVAVAGSFSHADTAGANTVAWSGTLRSKALMVGSYRLTATPAGGTAQARTFKIKR